MIQKANDMCRVAAVIVTFNGLNFIKKNLRAVKDQTYPPDLIVVVDNSSTDGSSEWLSQQPDIIHIVQKNSGSSGGQYTGIKYAYEYGADLIWSLDQDVIPYPDALESILLSGILNQKKNGFVSSLILAPDGSIAHINVPYIRKFNDILQAIANESPLPVISSSFGSVLISRMAVADCGLPSKSFFIWGDDVEYTMRMIKKGYKGYLLAKSRAVHHTPVNTEDQIVELNSSHLKTGYAIKNTVYTIMLRNELLYKSKIRGIISSIAFITDLFKKRFEARRFEDFAFYLKSVGFLFLGIFLKPEIELVKEKNEN